MECRRNQTINDTKIKYLSVENKIYEVTTIYLLHLYLEAKETNLSVDDVEESELRDISFFEYFQIRLINDDGEIKKINMVEYLKEKGDGE